MPKKYIFLIAAAFLMWVVAVGFFVNALFSRSDEIATGTGRFIGKMVDAAKHPEKPSDGGSK